MGAALEVLVRGKKGRVGEIVLDSLVEGDFCSLLWREMRTVELPLSAKSKYTPV